MNLEERRSPPYWRRKELLKEPQVPTMSEIREHVGDVLANVIFTEANEAQKDYLGLSHPLQGPPHELWQSPSDLLLTKVCLKPPLTQKYIQALTHQGILEMGAQIEQKFWNEMELEKERAVKEEGIRLGRIFEIEKRQLMEGLQSSMKTQHRAEMDKMKNYFEEKINELVTECYVQLTQLSEEKENELRNLNALWEEKLVESVNNVVAKLTEGFLEKMRLQEKVLVGIFKKKTHDLEVKHECDLNLEMMKSKEITTQLRHSLECQNVANLMYVLCKERKKCKAEKEALEKFYKDQIRKNKKHIQVQAKKIGKLTFAKNRRQKQLDTRERILIEILRQFQKFIYYALKASPTQGEFLLNIEKLIKFEVDDYCIQEKPTEVLAVVAATPRVVEEEKAEVLEDIAHYLQSSEEPIEEEFEESDVLPAFYFDEKMYVREDFRDMFSAGIKMSRHHPLWNKDVEELLKIFKVSTAEKKPKYHSTSLPKLKSYTSSVHFSENSEQLMKPGEKAETMSEKISVVTSPTEMLEKEIRKVSMVEYPGVKDMADKKKKKPKVIRDRVSISLTHAESAETSKSDIESRQLKEFAGTQSKLTLARDSVILHISTVERKSMHNISKAMLQETDSIRTKDDEEKKSTQSPYDEELQQAVCLEGSTGGTYLDDIKSRESLTVTTESETQRTSKLVLAQDSLELLRSNIGLVEKDASLKEEMNEKKSQLTFKKEVTVVKVAQPKQKKGRRKPIDKKRKAKVSPKATVVGARTSKEHEKGSEVFTEERIKSLVDLMKENPSLIRLFTACSQ